MPFPRPRPRCRPDTAGRARATAASGARPPARADQVGGVLAGDQRAGDVAHEVADQQRQPNALGVRRTGRSVAARSSPGDASAGSSCRIRRRQRFLVPTDVPPSSASARGQFVQPSYVGLRRPVTRASNACRSGSAISPAHTASALSGSLAMSYGVPSAGQHGPAQSTDHQRRRRRAARRPGRPRRPRRGAAGCRSAPAPTGCTRRRHPGGTLAATQIFQIVGQPCGVGEHRQVDPGRHQHPARPSRTSTNDSVGWKPSR